MAEKLLKNLAKENFGSRNDYIPLLHGRGSSIQPSTLIIKRKRAWWKKPFHHSEVIVLSKIEKYVDDTYKKLYNEVADTKLMRSEKKLQKTDVEKVVRKHNFEVKTTEHISLECKTNCNMGDLQLGTIDEEYYEDTDLREVLRTATLTSDKIKPYLSHKLYIVTGVIYSSMFKIVGKRGTTLDISGKISAKTTFGGWVGRMGSLKGGCSRVSCKAAMVVRNKKAPILFMVCPVEYDELTSTLKLPVDVFVGNVVARGITRVSLTKADDVKIEELAEVIEEEEEDMEVGSELFHNSELDAKLEAVKRLLLSVETKDERKTLVVKYLYLLETLLSGRENRLYLDGPYMPEKLGENEKGFLAQIGLQLNESTLSASENLLRDIQEYGLILQLIAARNNDELDDLEMILNEEPDKKVEKIQQSQEQSEVIY